MFFAQEVVRGEPRVNPRRRFTAATRNHPHLACTSNPSIGRNLEPNRRVQKNAGKRAVFDLGAGARRKVQEAASVAEVLSEISRNDSVYAFMCCYDLLWLSQEVLNSNEPHSALSNASGY
jgi:hypothetical protein